MLQPSAWPRYKRRASITASTRCPTAPTANFCAAHCATTYEATTWSSLISCPIRSARGAISARPIWTGAGKPPDHPFDIEWHPFQLNPDMPADGMDRRDYLETKFGGKEGAVSAYAAGGRRRRSGRA